MISQNLKEEVLISFD